MIASSSLEDRRLFEMYRITSLFVMFPVVHNFIQSSFEFTVHDLSTCIVTD
jgi:hypothetical protein